MRQTIVFLKIFTITLLLILGGKPCRAIDSEAQKVLTRLEKMWEIQKSEIVTAHFIYRQAHGQKLAVNTIKPLSPQQIDEIIYSIDYSSPENAFEQLITKLLNDISTSDVDKVEVFYAPPKFLFRTPIPPQYAKQNKTSFEFEAKVFDGNQLINIIPLAQQVHILKPGGGWTLDLLKSSHPFPKKEAIKKSQFSFLPEGLLSTYDTPDWRGTQLFDIECGITKDFSSLDKPGKTAPSIGRARYQRCLFTTSGSIVFPRLSVQVEYKKNEAVIAEIIFVDEAILNETISEDTFKVAIPEGMRVLDFRYNENMPAYEKAKQNTDNVISLVGEYYSVPEKKPPSVRWYAIVDTNLVILFLLIRKFLIRRSK